MNIFIEKETELELDFNYEEIIHRVITYSLDYIQCPYEAEVNVTLTDNKGIHEVNKEYRNIDRPTDVLSFPMIDYNEPGDFSVVGESVDCFNPDSGELILGDIMISIDKIKEQAEAYGHSQQRELGFLVAHSMLHLFGFDHMEEDDAKLMEEKQRDIMNHLQILR